MRNWVLGGLAAGSLLVMLLTIAAVDDMWSAGGVVGVLTLLTMSLMFGGLPGLAIGALIGALRKRAATRFQPAFPQSAPFHQQPPVPQFPTPSPPMGVPATHAGPTDRWGAMVGRCELSVRRVAAAAATVPPSPGAEWLNRIVGQFTAELNDVRRIADLGRALEATAQDHPVSQRLAAAVKDFTAFEDEAGRVALRLVEQPDLASARVHLEMLEQQVPNLAQG
ncbi:MULTISPECIES: hypothetical protein [Actinosynnema]|uniref:hypothetical protein n=1 Tax=Actinosynnema TaxID=40566 RepID=UPI0020A3C737|nr:hypothetical protein [Actinosynnema pretiosum]MCP2095160.1 hypothetical protein [Actinosynnema pretiosum]